MNTALNTPNSELFGLLARQRAAADADMLPDIAVRRDRLRRLLALVRGNRTAFEDALVADFGERSRDETLAFEVFTSVEDIKHTSRHLSRWMQPQRRPISLMSMPGRARLIPQPLGVVGVVVPWNYPLYLAISPLAPILAAGNRAMVKPSPDTPHFAALMAQLVADAFAPEELAIVEDEGPGFSALPFDHLFFTGSTHVGRLVMAAAAANLTPVTLELGGKSPVIVSPSFPLARVAEQVAFGKTANAGQTCVAPDYVLVPRGQAGAFIAESRAVVERFYPQLVGNPDYTAVINERQFARLNGYLDDARAKGATLHPLHGDDAQQGARQMVPTAITGVNDSMRLMQEEIFGPVMPVVEYDGLDEAIDFVKARPRPLALYIFSTVQAEQTRVLRETISGGVVINGVMTHVAQNNLPFGGVGASGMGQYHGREGFETFSKLKPVVYQSRFSPMNLMFPPRPDGRLRRSVNWMLGRQS
ncbi:Coniferyl-aldehyde dehydrogenase [Sphingobium chlorophenolicum L-1]|uniref:Aldehyde dehydrogenase n=1 Tax=Sphingobium chlorophenolicum L-1 TaxID=690566 RepID=F6EUH3_SPHCR|nr:coniferyl aldehyde dehydrogenase [Sphingobium chlorophenolicum]AEG47867.1 Coniferyl-aldehyde dehydrogenase [Sphingobium chlorophenolicum L-1]